ncbi:DNA mismatch repair proteins mutS family domain-containing protein [Entamoeba marina]
MDNNYDDFSVSSLSSIGENITNQPNLSNSFAATPFKISTNSTPLFSTKTPTFQSTPNTFNIGNNSNIQFTSQFQQTTSSYATFPPKPKISSQSQSFSQLDFTQQDDFINVQSKTNANSTLLTPMPKIRKENSSEVNDVPKTFRVVSISVTNNKLGFATLDIDEGILELSLLFFSPTDLSCLDYYLCQSSASLIITHPRLSPQILNHLKENEIGVEIRPFSEFTLESCRRNCEKTPFSFLDKQKDSHSIFVALSSFITFDANNELTKATGGLLAYYQQFISQKDENERQKYGINKIESIQWDSTLQINESALQSLYIFKKEQHPDIHSKGNFKEGMSLYGILNICSTTGGSKLLKEWMIRPKLDRYCIEERQQFQREFGKDIHNTTVNLFRKELRRSGDLFTLSNKLRTFNMTSLDWIKFYKNMAATFVIQEIMDENNFQHRIVSEILEHKTLIKNVVDCLNQVLDVDRFSEKKVRVKKGLNQEFDQIVDAFENLSVVLGKYSKKFNKKYCFFPKIGFLIESKKKTQADWEFKFRTKDLSYFKDEQCLRLDEEIGDINQQMKDAQTQIIDDLTLTLQEHLASFQKCSELLSEFDVLLCFVVCNHNYNWNLPLIVDSSSSLFLTQAKNPVVELTTEGFIPNDTVISDVPIHIITGPNSSGKSVYIRQVGMNVFLGILGCGIAAQYGEIPLFKRISTRITTKESSLTGLSAFTIDCTQMSFALRNVSPETLLLIDEFGKGTHPSDGFALLASLLIYLQKLGKNSPKTLVSTHFINVLNEIDQTKCVPMKMEVSIKRNKQIEFLYKLIPGITTSSYGIQCAEIAGLDENIIKRAEEVSKCLSENISILPHNGTVEIEKYYNHLVNRFYEFNPSTGNIEEFIQNVQQTASILSNLSTNK